MSSPVHRYNPHLAETGVSHHFSLNLSCWFSYTWSSSKLHYPWSPDGIYVKELNLELLSFSLAENKHA